MSHLPNSPLESLEPQLRPYLPTNLSTAVYINPTTRTFVGIYEHLRTLRRVLHDYVPRQVSECPPEPGEVRYEWQEGTLMFTDLAGFTRLTEIHAQLGRTGAETLLGTLNTYFANIIEIISMSGGDLLEFTGDALLVQFPPNPHMDDTVQAIRAGLRMQRAMKCLDAIETRQGTYSLKMRVGLHRGHFLTADIGTPVRMEHVLLGSAVQIAKKTEGAGVVDRVCITEEACQRVKDHFRFESHEEGYYLVIDDLSDEQLGEYDLIPPTRRQAANVLLDRSIPSLVSQIQQETENIAPLASFLPASTLRLVVQNVAKRKITPDFPTASVMFLNLVGIAERVAPDQPEIANQIVEKFSLITAMLNAEIEAHGGILKKITYHQTGSDFMILFGVSGVRGDDSTRAAEAALAVRKVVEDMGKQEIGGETYPLTCQIGMARGPVFAAEVGEPHGRREFNVLGDPVNTASRLMKLAQANQILITGSVQQEIEGTYECDPFGSVSLKGKTIPIELFGLQRKK